MRKLWVKRYNWKRWWQEVREEKKEQQVATWGRNKLSSWLGLPETSRYRRKKEKKKKRSPDCLQTWSKGVRETSPSWVPSLSSFLSDAPSRSSGHLTSREQHSVPENSRVTLGQVGRTCRPLVLLLIPQKLREVASGGPRKATKRIIRADYYYSKGVRTSGRKGGFSLPLDPGQWSTMDKRETDTANNINILLVLFLLSRTYSLERLALSSVLKPSFSRPDPAGSLLLKYFAPLIHHGIIVLGSRLSPRVCL